MALNKWNYEMQTLFLSTKALNNVINKVDLNIFTVGQVLRKDAPPALCCKCSACQPEKNKKPAKIRLSVAKIFDVDPWKGSHLIF